MNRWLTTVLVAVATAGCGAAASKDALLESVTAYNEGVRWQRFTAAAVAVPPAERDAFLDERERLADELKLTDYELVRVEPGERRASVQVKVTWFRDSEGIVRDTWIRQRWERQGPAWRVVEERRVRGAVMPGLADGDGAVAADRERPRSPELAP